MNSEPVASGVAAVGEERTPRPRRLLKFALFVTAIILLLGTVYASLLLPLLLSAFLCHLLLPFVDRLERRRVPRALAIAVIVVGTVVALGLAAVQFAPILYRQALSLVQLIPPAFSTIMQTWLPLAEKYVAGLGFVSAEEVHRYISGISLMSRIENHLQAGLAGLWATGSRLAGGLINMMLIPVLTFFMLKDIRRLATRMSRLVPPDLLPPTRDLLRRMDATLRTLVKGQVTVAGILAVMYVIGLSIVGLRSAIIIGVVAGVCRIVPYLDVVIGSVLSTVVLLSDFQGWGQLFGVVAVFLIVQAIDGAFVTPAVLGDRVGLHPMLVILSVIALANWWGFWGVLLAVPIVAMLKVIYETAKPYYLGSGAYEPR